MVDDLVAPASSPAPASFLTNTNSVASTSKLPAILSGVNADSPSAADSPVSEGRYISAYKTLSKNTKDNLFSELEVTHGASIHFELQQREFRFCLPCLI